MRDPFSITDSISRAADVARDVDDRVQPIIRVAMGDRSDTRGRRARRWTLVLLAAWVAALALIDWRFATIMGGLPLIVIGLLRRVGTEPRCAHCGYERAEPFPPACPECGSAWGQDDAVVCGARLRSWPMVAIGVIGILIASADLTRALDGETIIRRLTPTSFLLSRVERSPNFVAAEELRRRSLSPEDENRLADAVIAWLEDGSQSVTTTAWLAQRCQSRALPADTVARFYRAAFPTPLRLHTLPRVRDGEFVRVDLPRSNHPYAAVLFSHVYVDGAQFHLTRQGFLSDFPQRYATADAVAFRTAGPGPIAVRAGAWLVGGDPEALRGAFSWTPSGEPILPKGVTFAEPIELNAVIELVPRDWSPK